METYSCEEISVLLTFSELRLLLQAAGYQEINGIYMEQETVSEYEVICILKQLTQKGLLQAEDDRFVIQKQLGNMLRCMGEPGSSFVLEFQDGQFFYCYERGEFVLVTSLFQRKEKTMKLSLFSEKEYRSWKEQMLNDTGRY